MPFVYEMPEIGEGVVEGEIVAWMVKEGDFIERDAPLCEVMTDKATVEISSPTTGRVLKLHGQPGDIIKVHTPLAEIDENGAGAATPGPAPAPPAAPVTAPPMGVPSRAKPGVPAKAPPSVRRHAREEGVDLHRVSGTGPGGRITHDDVQQFIDGGATPMLPPALPQVRPSGTEERVRLIGMRRRIAEQMAYSVHTAAHFTYVEEVDGTKLVALREALKPKAAARGVNLSYIPFVMKACSVVFREFPNLNAVMDEEAFELVVKGDHNIGISTDTPDGLVVPVVKNVEQKSILHIAAELQALLERTRTGKASLDDLTGGTFTITSVGGIGGVLATPIIKVPEVAILGFNTIRDRAVVIDGEITIRKMFYLSPSFDHRIIDGALGARFTAALKAILEEPESLLLELA
ncbi:MAG: 2-oxo acid dehydrogenase subunit E2 [Deltaproteobacteria bacterium]|nr:2-oxo acid dehydrogenase subunit E2 [Deltaproteobacteria bacterium]